MTSVGAWLTRTLDGSRLDRLDCELLLAHALGLPRTTLLARPETPIPSAALAPLNHAVDELRRGVSVFYLLGTREFWGIELADPALRGRSDTDQSP